MGGTLEAEVQRGDGRLDHRSRKVEDMDVKYGPVHAISITPGGQLESILGKRQTMVNSLHRQAVAKLPPGLNLEASAPDGIIEAVSVKGAKAFAIGTQWHPEYKAASNPDSVKLFKAFGDAVRLHAARRMNELTRTYAPMIPAIFRFQNDFVAPWVEGFAPPVFSTYWKYLDIDLDRRRVGR